MSKSDLEAVVARRQTVARELAEFETKRANLLAEDRYLELTERVLTRLSDLCYGEPELDPSDSSPDDESMADRVARTIKSIVGTTLHAGRGALDMIRLAIEKRAQQGPNSSR